MKQVYDYQEIGTEIDQGKLTMFTCHPVARVSVQLQPDGSIHPIRVIIALYLGDRCLGIVEDAYTDMETLMGAFQINDTEEIWELLE